MRFMGSESQKDGAVARLLAWYGNGKGRDRTEFKLDPDEKGSGRGGSEAQGVVCNSGLAGCFVRSLGRSVSGRRRLCRLLLFRSNPDAGTLVERNRDEVVDGRRDAGTRFLRTARDPFETGTDRRPDLVRLSRSRSATNSATGLNIPEKATLTLLTDPESRHDFRFTSGTTQEQAERAKSAVPERTL